MNFTREPIIETIITPKDGYKLIVRSSKARGGEEFSVDAVEVISFGNALFFRSQERPKPFLVPVTDFEVVETKETRVVLKNASFDRSIKIGGGKDANVKAAKEKEEAPQEVEQRLEKKRERRRHRRRRGEAAQGEEQPSQPAEEKPAMKGGGAQDEVPTSSSPVSRLIPPPSGLISDQIQIPKESEDTPQASTGDVLPDQVEETPKKARRSKKAAKPSSEEKEPEEPPAPEEGEGGGEGGDANRLALTGQETTMSTSFSALNPTDIDPFGRI